MKNLIDVWLESDEEGKFSLGILYSNTSIFEKTLEGLSAFKAYKSLPEENERIKYGSLSSIDPLFLSLHKEEIDWIEREIPPYPILIQEIFRRRGISKEELEVLNQKPSRNPFKRKKIEKEKIFQKYGLISEDWKKMNEEYRYKVWKGVRKIVSFCYIPTSLGIYISTSDPIATISWLLSFPIPYSFLRYISFKIPKEKIRKRIDSIFTWYFFARSPIYTPLSILEFGWIAPLLARKIEENWLSLPDFLKKGIYKTHNWLSGVKTEKFDEREIRGALYDIKVDSPSIPNWIVEEYKQRIDNKIIEIEDPSKTLLHPYSLSYWRRKVVAIPKGKELEIVDKDYVRKLAQIEGIPLEAFKRKLEALPSKYLGYSLHEGRLVYARDIIGILPCDLLNALAYKEGYLTILAMKSDEIIDRKMIVNKLLALS
jgi:hypothetical protein